MAVKKAWNSSSKPKEEKILFQQSQFIFFFFNHSSQTPQPHNSLYLPFPIPLENAFKKKIKGYRRETIG